MNFSSFFLRIERGGRHLRPVLDRERPPVPCLTRSGRTSVDGTAESSFPLVHLELPAPLRNIPLRALAHYHPHARRSCSPASLSAPPSDMSEQPQVKRRRGTKHDRTGCLTCRARRKKCVENTLPRCGSCARLNLECVREPVRRVTGTSNAPKEGTIAAQPPQDGLVPGPAHGRSPSTRLFMRYYVNFLALKLTACGYQNSFLSGVSPPSNPAHAES